MEGIAKAASHFRDGSLFDDSGSTIGQVDFEFDTLLVNTAVYRRAFQQYMAKARNAHRQQPAIIPEEPYDDVRKDEEYLTTLSSERTAYRRDPHSGYLMQQPFD